MSDNTSLQFLQSDVTLGEGFFFVVVVLYRPVAGHGLLQAVGQTVSMYVSKEFPVLLICLELNRCPGLNPKIYR